MFYASLIKQAFRLLVLLTLLPLLAITFMSSEASAESMTVFAVTTTNQLIAFNSSNPGIILSSKNITGLQNNETIAGIDFRPSNTMLYAIGSSSTVYTINTATGAATAVGPSFAPALAGTDFGVDFNPVPDLIRITSDGEQNLRVSPVTGALVMADTALAYDGTDANAGANPNVIAVAYSNNFFGSAVTTLYGIDSDLDILVTQGGLNGNPSPNLGGLFTRGALNVNTTGVAGFDIASNGAALAALNLSGESVTKLHSINLATGAATLLGTIGQSGVIQDIAIVLPKPPQAFAVTVNNNLLSFNTAVPGTILSTVSITGIQSGDSIVGIDFRPATGQLYAFGSLSNLYTINTQTGAATQVGSTLNPALSGTSFGFDFNPTVDRIRVVNDAEQNIRLHPVTGALAMTDSALDYDGADPNNNADPNIVAAAYTNNFFGSTSTTLFDIDSNLNILVRQGGAGGNPSPNLGGLFTIGALGVDPTAVAGFDIGASGAAFAALQITGETASKLFRINLVSGAATLIGAIGSTDLISDIAIVLPQSPNVFGITSANNLVSFNSADPSTLLSTVAVTGLVTGDNIVGIDFRPATGQLYALGSLSNLYTINLQTGAATQIGATFATALTGTEFGFDFNPTVDRIRIVSDSEQNLRVHPVTGAVVMADSALDYDANDPNDGADPNIVGAAYTNNRFAATTTTLYDIDSNLNILVTQGGPGGNPSPNLGGLFTVGALNVNPSSTVGFDISGSGAAFAAFVLEGESASKFYFINLSTGAATLVGLIGGTEAIRDIAIVLDREVLISNDFEDGILDWNVLKGKWQEIGGALVSSKGTIFASTPWSPSGLSECSVCTIEIDMQTTGGRITLQGWFKNGSNRVDLIMNEAKDVWMLRQRSGGGLVTKAKASATIDPNVNYHLLLSFDGTNFQLIVDGVVLFTVPAGATPSGNSGIKVKNATGTFRSFMIY
jgi:hypothetical protein